MTEQSEKKSDNLTKTNNIGYIGGLVLFFVPFSILAAIIGVGQTIERFAGTDENEVE